MNKKILYSILILLSFCFAVDVNALGEEIEPYYDFDYGSGATKTSLFTELPVIKKDVSTLNDNQLANYNNILLEKENNCADYDSYIITTKTYNGSGYTDNISLLCYNSELNQNTEPYIAVDYTTYSGNSKYAYLYYYLMLYKSDSVDYYYTAYGTTSSGNSKQMQSGQANDDNNLIIAVYNYKDVGTTFGDSSFVIDTNIDMTFKSTDYKIIHTPTLASFKMNETIYNEGDFGYNDGILYDKSKDTTPTISITKESENSIEINENEYIIDITLNIEFSNIDNDKYIYLYKYGSESDWITIALTQSNSISKTFTSNDTLYVQVLDISTTEVVLSATYTINQINYDNTPYITFGLVDDEMCFANDVHICERLIIDSHITNFDQYSFYIFNHTLNQTLLGSTSQVNYYVYENSTIEVRIIDRYTNEVVADEFYTISSISTDASLGHYISSTCNMNLENGKYDCTYYIYNYDFEKYNYYYGTSTSIFKVIIPSELSSSIDTSLSIPTDEDTHLYKSPTLENVYILEKSYYEDTIAQFKIIDKETSEQVYYIEFNHDMAIKEDNSDINEVIQFVDKYILSKFPIVKQLGHIHECFTQFNFEDFYLVSPPSFTFDLSFINLEPVEVEMKVDDTIRFEVQTIIKAFATLSVVFVFVKEIGKILP